MDYEGLMALIPKPIIRWTTSDVEKWLQFIHLEQLIPIFKQKSIDGSCIQDINEIDMKTQLQIKSNIIVKKLLKWIKTGFLEFDQKVLVSPIIQQFNQSRLNASRFDEFSSQTSQELQELLVPTQNYSEQSHLSSKKMNQFTKQKTRLKKGNRVFLIVKRLQCTQAAYYKFIERDCKFGRNYNCDILAADQRLDMTHAIIHFQNSHYYIRNLSKVYGTFVKLRGQTKLKNNMIVEMGYNLIQFIIDPRFINIIHAIVISGPNLQEKFSFDGLEKQKITIGRRVGHDINFTSDTTLSNYHVKLTFIQSEQFWYLEDLNATNGTWIQIQQQEEVMVTNGVIFKLGTTSFSYQCYIQMQGDTDKQQVPGYQEENLEDFQKQKHMCMQCHENQRNIMLWPCKHCIICENCAKNFIYCILCHQKVIQTTKIYRG